MQGLHRAVVQPFLLARFMPSSALHIRLLTAADARPLADFEHAHRAWFEQWVQARPAHFYTPAGFAEEMEAALLRQARDQAFHYLVWESDALVGRINLTHVLRAHHHSASLGYRVAPHCTGRGIASQAVAALLPLAFGTHQLQRIEATARAENPASVHILGKHGFVQYGHSRRSFELGGQWFGLLHFEAHKPPAP